MPFQWPERAKAALSFVYDDGHISNAEIAAYQLEAHKIRGTFYLSKFNIFPHHISQWQRVRDAGHELANHTWTHPNPQSLANHTAASFIEDETGKMEQWMNDNFGEDQRRTYRYVWGYTKLGVGTPQDQTNAYQEVVRATFIAAGSGQGDTQDPLLAPEQRYDIASRVPTWESAVATEALEYIDRTVERGHWGVLVFHHIVDGPKGSDLDTTKSVHAEIIEYARSKGQDLWIVPFREVFDEIIKQVGNLPADPNWPPALEPKPKPTS
jgi:peptidoglycan/xylan/chitin deacetylase (PgdA/CDA1 family)